MIGLVTTLNRSGSRESWEFSNALMVEGNEAQGGRHEVVNNERVETAEEII